MLRFGVVAALLAVLLCAVSGEDATNFATWIKLDPTPLSLADQAIAYHVNGLPPPTCDHSTVNLGGGKLLSSFGSSDNDANKFFNLQDLWVYNIASNAWSILVPNAGSILPRTAPLAAFNSATGELWVFGGYAYDGIDEEVVNYADDINVFDTHTNEWRVIVPNSVDFVSNVGPSGRAWTDWTFVNENAPDVIFLFGGSLTLDGQVVGPHAHDGNDLWFYSTSTQQWTGDRNLGACNQTTTVCSDSGSIANSIAGLGADVTAFTALMSDGSLRPADKIAALTQLLQYSAVISSQLNNSLSELRLNSSLTENVNDTSACTASCTLYESEALYDRNAPPLVDGVPKRLEGQRSRCIDGACYMFGGYSCATNGQNTDTGPKCYSNDMFIYNLTTAKWVVLSIPSDVTDPQYALWPSYRAYSSLTLHRRKLYVFGGGYTDQAQDTYYSKDVHVFNIDTRLWEPIEVRGDAPAPRWSHTVTSISDADPRLFVFAGCAAPVASFNDLYTLHIGLKVEPSNLKASGDGLKFASAGEVATFTIEARETLPYLNGTSGVDRSRGFGPLLSWGSSLPLRVEVVGSFAGQPVLSVGTVTDLGGGRYSVSYIISRGSSIQIFVSLDDQLIPNAPFIVALHPAEVSAVFASTSGVGLTGAVVGQTSQFVLHAADVFGNPLTALSAANHSAAILRNLSISLYPSNEPVSFTVIDSGDGTYLVTYFVPESVGTSFRLAVKLFDLPVVGSPFAVAAYTDPALSPGLVTAAQSLVSIALASFVALLAAMIHYRNEKAMKAGSPLFMGLMVCGGIIGLLSVFLLTEVTDSRCLSFPFVFSIGFDCLISSLFGKTWRVAQIFGQQHIVKVQLNDAKVLLFPAVTIVVDLLYYALWSGLHPMQATSVVSPDGFSHYRACDGPHFTIWSTVSYSYHGLMLIYGVFLASNTASVPNAFNESRYLAVTLYNSAICAISIGILFVFNDNLDAAFATKFVAIFYSMTFAVFVMILPRIYYCIYPPDARFFAMDGGGVAGHTTIPGGAHASKIGGGSSGPAGGSLSPGGNGTGKPNLSRTPSPRQSKLGSKVVVVAPAGTHHNHMHPPPLVGSGSLDTSPLNVHNPHPHAHPHPHGPDTLSPKGAGAGSGAGVHHPHHPHAHPVMNIHPHPHPPPPPMTIGVSPTAAGGTGSGRTPAISLPSPSGLIVPLTPSGIVINPASTSTGSAAANGGSGGLSPHPTANPPSSESTPIVTIELSSAATAPLLPGSMNR